MKEIIFYGIGGQGVVTASDILAFAVGFEGKFSQSFPYFGVERRGAPVTSYCRIDKKPIRIHMRVYKPDIAVVFEPKLLDIMDITSNLKGEKLVIINSIREKRIDANVYYVDASSIAMKYLKKDIVNTSMLGALARVTKIVSLKSLKKAINEWFGENELSGKNIKSMEMCYKTVRGGKQ